MALLSDVIECPFRYYCISLIFSSFLGFDSIYFFPDFVNCTVNDLAVINKAVNDMRQDVLCKALILAVYVGKSDGAALNSAFMSV